MIPQPMWRAGLVGALVAGFVAGCGGGLEPATVPATVVIETQVVAATETLAPAPTQPPAATPALTTATPAAEARVVELEWPPQMRLGDSDVVRLALVPSNDGYMVTTEFPDHTTLTSTVAVARPGGYNLAAVARLDGIGFVISPEGEQVRGLPLGEIVTWRWTLSPRAPGQQRLSLLLLLRWTPSAGSAQPGHDTEALSRAMDVRVSSVFGMTTARATMMGALGLIFGSSLSLMALILKVRPPRPIVQALAPNTRLVIEPHPALDLTPSDRALLQALFGRYARLVVESEFRSGYSGARTFLALPVRADGRADAHTIVKIGDQEAIRREFENYENFVKDTLPPITARIQGPPVTTTAPARPGGRRAGAGDAALRYTFIAEPGRKPISLRECLLSTPDPTFLEKLFSTFGPNWWMQRSPYTFRLAQEYDRMLPAHYVLEPAPVGRGKVIDGRAGPSACRLKIGDEVIPQQFPIVERRADRRSLSLVGEVTTGQPPLRLRWLGRTVPSGATGRVVATRQSLLQECVSGFERHGLPDPLARLPELLAESVTGTRSTIHGDLNLENILVGPGGFAWLIDFAQTRDGHTLYDFAHLEAEIIAHILAPQLTSAAELLDSLPTMRHPLLSSLHLIAGRCLLNPSQPREYMLAVYMACLGALKYSNLDRMPKHFLYLTAAHLSQTL